MPSRILQSFIQVTFAAVIAFGISLPARADDSPAPTDAVSRLEETLRPGETRSGAIWQFFYETHHEGTRVSGLSLFFSGDTSFAGVTAQQIRSPKITYNGHPDNLESVYLFYGLQMDLPITPFIEAGIDVGDWLAEDLSDDSKDDEASNTESSQNESSIIDYCFAIGVQTRMGQSLFMRAYYKMYIIQQENRSTPVPAAGIQLGMRF